MAKTIGVPTFIEWLVCVIITVVGAVMLHQCWLWGFHQPQDGRQTASTVFLCISMYHASIYLRGTGTWPFQTAGK